MIMSLVPREREFQADEFRDNTGVGGCLDNTSVGRCRDNTGAEGCYHVSGEKHI